MWQKRATEQLLYSLERIRYGSISVTLPDGVTHRFIGPQDGPHGELVLHDLRTIPALAAKGDIGLTEAYRDGWWDSDDIASLLMVGLRNEAEMEQYVYGNLFSRLASRLLYLFTRNSMRGSRRNIQAHYDLGNDFYELWLDPTMTYSSALYDGPSMALQSAQYNKYDRIIDRLGGRSGSLLEIGCGWGGFADRALERGDFGIKGITLSREQQEYARNRLGGNAQILLEDYRTQRGKYDHIVSIEMFEAVGEAYWKTYFSSIKSLLAASGRAVVQTITIGEPYFERYRSSGDMIRTFIFPGGMLPSPTRFAEEAAAAGLQVTDAHGFGMDYATTLEAWSQRFESNLPSVRALGFDEAFVRIWRMYLQACIATFRAGRTSVMQMELQHA